MTLVFLSVSVFSLCEDIVIANETCEMQTPYLECSSNYTLINSNGSTLEGEMILINNNIYKFNFTKDIGNYTLILCDETTKNITVVGDKYKMILNFGTLFIIFAIGLIFLFLGEFVKNDVFFIIAGVWYIGMSLPARNISIIYSGYLNLAFFIILGLVCIGLTHERRKLILQKRKDKIIAEARANDEVVLGN